MKKYESIRNTLQKEISEGQLTKGQRLPSIRELSNRFDCNKDTIVRALNDLKHEKIIYSKEKSGYYVLGKSTIAPNDHHLNLNKLNQAAFNDFRMCLDESLENQESDLLDYYYKEQGLDELLTSMEYYFRQNALYSSKDNIIITSGTQQALYILSQMPFSNNKKTILIEKPTYSRMEKMLKKLQIPYLTIERDFDGINFQILEDLFKSKDIKFFYTIPRFSNPLALSYSNKEKEILIELAGKYDVYIIEDDFLGDFSKPSDLPLHYYDTKSHVIYLKSFSMSVFPSLRIGSIIMPEILQKNFLDLKAMIDLDTNLMMQKALSRYLSNGMFEKNLKGLIEFFQKQKSEIVREITDLSIQHQYAISPQHLIMQLPKDFHFQTIDKNWLITINMHRYLKLPITPKIISQLNAIFNTKKNPSK